MSSTFLTPFAIVLSIINSVFLTLTIWAALQLRGSDWWIVFLAASIMGLLYEVDYREFRPAAQPLSTTDTPKCAARDLATTLSTAVPSRYACATSMASTTATPSTALVATALTARASAVTSARTLSTPLSFALRLRTLVLAALLPPPLPASFRLIKLVLLVDQSLQPSSER